MAIVMPEIGFDELPMRPVMRDDTLTKKKPNTTVSTAASGLPYVGRLRDDDQKHGQSQRADDARTSSGRSRSVRTARAARRLAESFHALAEATR